MSECTIQQKIDAAKFGRALAEFSFASHKWLKGHDLVVAVRNAMYAFGITNPDLYAVATIAYENYPHIKAGP